MKGFQLERNSETAMNGLRNYLREHGFQHENIWYLTGILMNPKFLHTLESGGLIKKAGSLSDLERRGVKLPDRISYAVRTGSDSPSVYQVCSPIDWAKYYNKTKNG